MNKYEDMRVLLDYYNLSHEKALLAQKIYDLRDTQEGAEMYIQFEQYLCSINTDEAVELAYSLFNDFSRGFNWSDVRKKMEG